MNYDICIHAQYTTPQFLIFFSFSIKNRYEFVWLPLFRKFVVLKYLKRQKFRFFLIVLFFLWNSRVPQKESFVSPFLWTILLPTWKYRLVILALFDLISFYYNCIKVEIFFSQFFIPEEMKMESLEFAEKQLNSSIP